MDNKANIAKEKNGDYVVILHGIAITSRYMIKLSSYLKKSGYDVINLNYPSTKYRIEELAEIINQEITKKVIQDKKIHFVGYSMGGLVVRSLIAKYKYKNLGRVVQVATPNKGSEISNIFKNFWLYKKFLGPAGQQLITDQEKYKDMYGEINFELGIIAGDSIINKIFIVPFLIRIILSFMPKFILSGPSDGLVTVENTMVDGMKDHIVLRVSHIFMPFSKQVQKQTLYFIENGNFLHLDYEI